MFQKLRGAFDALAEEQARAKANALERTTAPSTATRRSGSVSRAGKSESPARRPRTKKPSQDVTKDNADAPNPDPAVFEAAFVIDDSEEPSRAGTPMPLKEKEKEKVAENGEAGTPPAATNGESAQNTDEGKAKEASNESQTKPAVAAPTIPELPPEIRAKLRKLEKLEATYPELLRSYRVAHGRATSIEPFERALRENTPLTSIKDPGALIEYLNQLSRKGDMVMDEFKRVSAEKDEVKKKCEEAEKKLSALQEEMSQLKVGHPNAVEEPAAGPSEEADKASHSRTPSASKSPVASVMGMFSPKQKARASEDNASEAFKAKDAPSEEFFSFENEIPQLQADLAAKSEEVDTLKAEIKTVKEELAAAKEQSASLAESLEKATKDLGESRDAAAASDLQTQLDARNKEVASLTKHLESLQASSKELESKLDAAKTDLATTKGELEKQTSDSTVSAGKIKELESKVAELVPSIESLQAQKKQDESKIADLTKQLSSAAVVSPSAPAATTHLDAPQPAAGSGKKKNKKKKKGGAAAAVAADAASDAGTDQAEAPHSPLEGPAVGELQAEIKQLKDAIADKDAQIERLSKQRKTEEDLREEIETLQDNLVNIGQDHVEAKEKLKTLGAEKTALEARVAELEKQLASSKADAGASGKLQTELDTLRGEYNDLLRKSDSLKTDLGAAEQLAQTRYKDLTDLKDMIQKVQPELQKLRQDSTSLSTTREELVAKVGEVRALEKREKELKNELARAQRLATDREAEIKSLREKLTAETNNKLRLEDAQRVAGRDLRRSEAEKVELSARQEKSARELKEVQDELARLRPRTRELEDDVSRLAREKKVAVEEAELRAQQYANAQELLGSMRDQTGELTVQLREARSRADELDEELAEVQRLLGERTREGETMRRMLADVDERADARVREMRTRMEAAVEERDRVEDESSALARRKTRETEELKGRVRDLEKEVRSVAGEKEALEEREREWRKRREEVEAQEKRAAEEMEGMRATVGELRAALDASEGQVREAEKQKGDLRRLLEEARGRFERVSKELKTAQAKLSAGGTAAASGRSSLESTRSGIGANGVAGPGAGAGPGVAATDTMYLKTILLQFLEQKDARLRGQLVPVLGKLLRFDKSDEQKWMAAVQHLGTR